MLNKLLKDLRGTALLTALLVMGVLVSVSLALTALIVREASFVKGVVDAGRAYYAAESGIELALYELNTGLPQSIDDGEVLMESSNGSYVLKNTCKAYPCFDDDEYDRDSGGSIPASVYYDVLDLNESIMIPLFVVKEGVEVPVKDFTVEFYGKFDLNIDFKDGLIGGQLNSWDVLRWKAFGLHDDGRTESISDFTAITTLQTAGGVGEDFLTYSEKPSWFGSVGCTGKSGRYFDGIDCEPYVSSIEVINVGDQESPVYAGSCDTMHAREAYVTGVDGKVEVEECYSIQDFLHRDDVHLKYLSLTNLMNPGVFKDGGDTALEKSKIYFRVELFDGETVRNVADISADGYSGKSRQSINVKVERGSFMPVFNFSLYSTSKEGSVEEWYSEEH